MFETSLQAQFLIPMATTIVFGLAVTTALVLFLVPATLGISRDLGMIVSAIWRGIKSFSGWRRPNMVGAGSRGGSPCAKKEARGVPTGPRQA